MVYSLSVLPALQMIGQLYIPTASFVTLSAMLSSSEPIPWPTLQWVASHYTCLPPLLSLSLSYANVIFLSLQNQRRSVRQTNSDTPRQYTLFSSTSYTSDFGIRKPIPFSSLILSVYTHIHKHTFIHTVTYTLYCSLNSRCPRWSWSYHRWGCSWCVAGGSNHCRHHHHHHSCRVSGRLASDWLVETLPN